MHKYHHFSRGKPKRSRTYLVIPEGVQLLVQRDAGRLRYGVRVEPHLARRQGLPIRGCSRATIQEGDGGGARRQGVCLIFFSVFGVFQWSGLVLMGKADD